jgi:uncharacterized repeat protein (TIGR03803 family)
MNMLPIIKGCALLAIATLLVAVQAQAAPTLQVTPGATLTTEFSSSVLTSPATNSDNFDGCNPLSTPVIGQDGTLYGNMAGCGRFGNGTAYSFSSAGGKKVYKVLHTFSAARSDGVTNFDGMDPRGDTVQDSDGNIYSTASLGGSGGCGTVYSISSAGVFKMLHGFTATDANGFNHGGCSPFRGVILGSDGALYGATFSGGSHGDGAIYKLNTDGSSFTVLHEFAGGTRDGIRGNTDLTEIGSTIYGVTSAGCSINASSFGEGCIFSISENGAIYGIVYDFRNSICSSPHGGVTLGPDNMLYGTTVAGGANGDGCIYRVGVDGSDFQVLWSFSATTGTEGVLQGGTNLDGADPIGLLIVGQDGRLYGTAEAGGSNGNGTMFAIDTSGNFSLLRSFDAIDSVGENAYGAAIDASLVETSAGVFVGVAGNGGGGVNGTGAIFTLTLPSSAPATDQFPEIVGAPAGVLETSDPIVISGFAKPRTITVSGGSYSINGGAFTTSSGTAANGDLIQLQTTTSATPGAAVSVSLQFTPGNSKTFKVVTH